MQARRKPLAQAIALMLVTGSMMGSAHAQQAFSAGWFAAKGAIRSQAALTGRLPNGMPASSASSPLAQQQKANAQLALSITNLNMAARSIAMQQGQQALERQKALKNDASVPDGLGEGGLDVDTDSLTAGWLNAMAPVQSQSGGRTDVTIQQTADKAILNWETFNVGKNTTVEFLQQKDWAVLNQVNDPLARPSQIQGQIKADGTVLIANRNGIVFTGSSQVDTRNLVAAAADISNSQFTTSGIYSAQASGAYVPSFTNASGALIVEPGAQINTAPSISATQGGGYALLLGKDVINGGTVTTPGGQATFAAGDFFIVRPGQSTTTNQYSTTQGNEVAPQFNIGSTAGNVTNTGLLVATEGDITLAGRTIVQDGIAEATTSVNKRGTIHLLTSASDASSSVTITARGLNAILLDDNGGTALDSQRDAMLAASATQDIARRAAALGVFDNLSQQDDRKDLSRVEIVSGGNVNFDGGSTTLATGGQIVVSAGKTNGRSTVSNGAILDVSGSVGVNVAMDANNVLVNVQGNEQRDAPVNRDSTNLNNSDVWIDRRNLIFVPAGTGGDPNDRWYTAGGLLEVSGYLGLANHGIGEWAAQGGTVAFAGSEVVTQAGANINLSGGSLNVQTGMIRQTWLKGANGHLYEASNAPADVLYTGLYKGFEATHERWGPENTEYFYNPLIAPQQRLENGYTTGRDAGQMIVGTNSAVLEGDITAKTYQGPQQTQKGNTALDGYEQSQKAAAMGAQLILGSYLSAQNTDPKNGPVGVFHSLTPTFDNIVFGDEADISATLAGGALPADRVGTAYLNSGLLNGFELGGILAAANDTLTVDGALTVTPGGGIELYAPQVMVNADLIAHGGTIALGNIFKSYVAATGVAIDLSLPTPAGSSAAVTVGANVTLDASGEWSNLLLDRDDVTGLAYVDGGSVSVRDTGAVTLSQGSVIDVSSGAALLKKEALRGGVGGDVTLASDAVSAQALPPSGALLTLDGAITAVGVNGGGTLSIGAPSVLIGDDVSATAPGQLVLPSSFFAQGFSHYDIDGYNGVTVAAATSGQSQNIDVVMPVYQFAGGGTMPTGAVPASALQVWLPPVYIDNAAKAKITQRGGAGIALSSERNGNGGAIDIGTGSVLSVDPGQAITIAGAGTSQITIDGTLNAWGGDIAIDIANAQPGVGSNTANSRSIWIGEHAVLDAKARAVTFTDAFGRTDGVVPDGGTISIGGALDWEDSGQANAVDAFVVIARGARLDASGASATLDVAAGNDFPPSRTPLLVASDGGSIILKSNNGLYIDGSLLAVAGGAGAAGGTLAIALETPTYDISRPTLLPDDAVRVPREIIFSQTDQGSGLDANAQPGQADASLVYGAARLSADKIAAGGFDNLSLLVNGALSFDGSVALHMNQGMRLTAGEYGLAQTAAADSVVNLSTPYVMLAGTTRVAAQNFIMPTFSITDRSWTSSQQASAGSFNVDADLIDIRDWVGSGTHGSIKQKDNSLQVEDRRGFDQIALDASEDMRFLTAAGAPVNANTPASTHLTTPGDISLTAAQLYPATGAIAEIIAGYIGIAGYAPGSTLNIARAGEAVPDAPLSVFGKLSLGADTINQGGIVHAPLGLIVIGQTTGGGSISTLNLAAGSITSVSAAGLTMPYGGTVDGLSYQYDGKDVVLQGVGGMDSRGDVASGIHISGQTIAAQSGSVLDLSGGGELTGAGFISGRGGSVDILRTPLASAGPNYAYSSADNKVYAIVPSRKDHYAPVAADNGDGDPIVGQQVTIGAGVPGLPAGTYTLLPSTYALLPGAYRVELGGAVNPGSRIAKTADGSYITGGYLGVANTGIKASLPTQVIVTAADKVRTHSQYNEMDFAAFVQADAASLGVPRAMLPADAKTLELSYFNGGSLTFDGVSRFNADAANGGFGGTLLVTGGNIEILGAGAAPTPGFTGTSLYANTLNAFDANRIAIGAAPVVAYGQEGAFASFSNTINTNITVRSGATLAAPEVFLVSGNPSGGIVVEQGATINTVGQGDVAFDSNDGFVYAPNFNAVLAVSNGWVNMLANATGAPLGSGPGAISIGTCAQSACSGAAQLYSEGTIAAATDKAFTLADNALYGTRNLVLGVSAVNIGSAVALAAAAGQLPPGLSLNQDLLNHLLAGNTDVGAPALETLVFNVSQSVNIYGSVTLDTLDVSGHSSLERLVLGTPAIYGYGAASDTATIRTGEFVWSGTSGVPGAAVMGLLGDSTLNIDAGSILFGYGPNTQPSSIASVDRIAVGFNDVNLNASEKVSANFKGAVGIYHQQGAYVEGQGYQYTGGDLNIVTPLLTGDAGSVNAITAGGNITVSAPAGTGTGADPQANSDALGATLSLSAQNITIDSAIVLPTGKLTLNAVNDVTLNDGARIDLSGRAVAMFDQTVYSWGGDLILSSDNGNIKQAAGSSIDLSASNNRGGTLQATALGTSGNVDLAGIIQGASGSQYDAGGTLVPYEAGEVTIKAQTIADFTGLNSRLNDGGVFGARRFQLKQGDLVVGDGVRANDVEIAVDGGSLTINGTIDASGQSVGTIRLAAMNDLTINGTLDAHGTGLRVDSYGKIIDAPNRAIVDLTTRTGTLTLGSASTIDLRVGTGIALGTAPGQYDGVARGTLDLNAPRLGGTGGEGGVDSAGNGANDVAVNVLGTPTIRGAESIAVNAFRIYDDAPLASAPDVTGHTPQEITQGYLDGIDGDSTAFINAALGNVTSKLAGLGSYHLRPGVEVDSKISAGNPNGDISIAGDLDLSNYRYGPDANRTDPALRGFGEPGVLTIRAAGNLNIYGSINDGFAPPPTTPDDSGWWLGQGVLPFGGDLVLPSAVTLDIGTIFQKGVTLNYNLAAAAMSLPAGTVLPVKATLTGSLGLPAGTVVGANIYKADGSIAYAAGTVLPNAVTLTAGMQLGAGTVLSAPTDVAALTWPKGVPLPVNMTSGSQMQLAAGSLIPSMTNVKIAGGQPVELRSSGQNWAVAPMLAAGTASWSMQYVAGADMNSADTRALNLNASGSIILADTHYQLKETDVVDSGHYIITQAGHTLGMPGATVPPSLVKICTLIPADCMFIPGTGAITRTLTYFSPLFSVLRTGTGDLDMLAAADFKLMSLYGVYTAGTQSPGIAANGSDPFNRLRGMGLNGETIAGSSGLDYSASLASYQAWYPEHGGNVLISTGGDVIGDMSTLSDSVGNWLWRQGNGSALSGPDSIPTAWWINFGAYGLPPGIAATAAQPATLVGFAGIGALGGGNVSIIAGGDAGIIAPRGDELTGSTINQRSQGLNVAVGSTGRVGLDGQLTLTGGGDINIRISGALNPNVRATQDDPAETAQQVQNPDLNGKLSNLRGSVSVMASAIGGIDLVYPTSLNGGANMDSKDTRVSDPFTPSVVQALGGIGLILGDSTVYLDTLSDLVLGGAGDPGRTAVVNTEPFTFNGQATQGGQSWFSLWTSHTAINLFSAGGNLTPINLIDQRSLDSTASGTSDYAPTDNAFVYPSILRAVAAGGSIYYGPSYKFRVLDPNPNANVSLWLAPSLAGELDFLAGNSIYGGGYAIDMSGSDTPLPTPFNPAFIGRNSGSNSFGIVVRNTSNDSVEAQSDHFPLFAFGPNTPINGGLHDDPNDPIRFYAVNGDIVGLRTGEILSSMRAAYNTPSVTNTANFPTWYIGGAPVDIRAGRDIVNTGTQPGTSIVSPFNGAPSTGNIIVQDDLNAVSIVSAGRDIIYANFQVAGPGTLEISAGRNILQQDKGSITSIGPIVLGDTRPGASILMQAGVGANGPDYSDFAQLYLDPAHLADPNKALADQPGKVVKNYDGELVTWLGDRYGFAGTTDDALAYFNALAPEQQGIFLRQVYFAELTAGGREFNEVDGQREGSYLRGRNAIAALFPDKDVAGNTITYQGDITLYGGAGVHTNFGGDIQMLTPGGGQTFGIEGNAPPSTAGIITQGAGNIQLYSLGSILLGQSRVMTTFGGDILAWSAEGDINAGRGSKTTVVFTPPKRIYDNWGNVTLSPDVPSTGAGIATLAPIPEVVAGDVDLIAPLGTIDAGEAGVRFSGSANFAALQIVNAANIKGDGKVTGVPLLAAVNVGALTNASAAAAQATVAAQDVVQRDRNAARQNLPSIFTVRVLGFGNEDGSDDANKGKGVGVGYNSKGVVQVLGAGELTAAEMQPLTQNERRGLSK